MRYRWFNHGHGKTMTTWQFLNEEQISKLVAIYKDKTNCFQSVQHYDKDGSDKKCPVYADFDRGDAHGDALKLYKAIHKEFNVYPCVYSSGGKGYHIEMPVNITHPKCEKIAKYIVSSLDPGKSWDFTVYKSRNMWRIPDTLHYNSGNYKTKVGNKEFIYDDLNKEKLKKWIAEAKEQIEEDEKLRPDNIEYSDGNWKRHLTPCVEQLLSWEPPEGIRHSVRVLLARFFRSNGVPMDEAIEVIMQNNFYKSREKYLVTVFNSIYNSKQPKAWGCKNEEILQMHCSSMLCIYGDRI